MVLLQVVCALELSEGFAEREEVISLALVIAALATTLHLIYDVQSAVVQTLGVHPPPPAEPLSIAGLVVDVLAAQQLLLTAVLHQGRRTLGIEDVATMAVTPGTGVAGMLSTFAATTHDSRVPEPEEPPDLVGGTGLTLGVTEGRHLILIQEATHGPLLKDHFHFRVIWAQGTLGTSLVLSCLEVSFELLGGHQEAMVYHVRQVCHEARSCCLDHPQRQVPVEVMYECGGSHLIVVGHLYYLCVGLFIQLYVLSECCALFFNVHLELIRGHQSSGHQHHTEKLQKHHFVLS